MNFESFAKRLFGRSLLALTATVLMLGVTSDARADSREIVISDSTGVARAQGELDDAGQLKFSVSDAAGVPAQSAEITLTNTTTGEVITTQSVDGIASFQGVAPGSWTVASVTPGITFTEIQVGLTPMMGSVGVVGSLSTLSAATVAGGAAVVGATAIGVVAATDSNDDDDDDDEPISPST